MGDLADFVPAGNQGGDPDTYEIENRALDPQGHVLEAMRHLAPWNGRTPLDLGCGSGYWLSTSPSRTRPSTSSTAASPTSSPRGGDAGLAEVLRVLRPGGALVVVDNDHRHGEFAGLLADSPWAVAQGRGDVTDQWWRLRGACRVEVMSEWRFEARNDPTRLQLSYGYVLFARRRT